ncbi:MAG: hypothetical protein K1X72_22350 [Pyrinomonadaceae bacterium]|nr:hypothetical protein [Pyrinomonadaceae bacterium]
MRICLYFFLFTILVVSNLMGQTVAQVIAPSGDDKDKKTETKKTEEVSTSDPLIKLLATKGLISTTEANLVSQGTPTEQRDKLAKLLYGKGLISMAEFEAVKVVVPANPTPSQVQTAAVSVPSTSTTSKSTPAQTAAAVIPAITPLRVLTFEGAKRDGLIPDIKLGSGAKMKLYGFFKTSVVWDSSNPSGNDFPLPGFLSDSGPNGAPTFHLKARAFRIGANFEWLDPAPKTSITGRFEMDFEGDFTRATNRNISSIRSSQPSIRLAWVRIDRAINEKTTAHVLFGQDWTPFGSSTMPNIVETTGFHLAYGNIYERAPQVRTGFSYNFGTKRNVKFMPEFALVLPIFGNTPSDAANQLGFGERQGPDSNQPELEGRFVLQFQADKAAGVAPAQLITSWIYGKRKAIVPRANVPAAFLAAFPNGAETESERYGYTGEFQLPTRWFTLIGKYYQGADLRAYFGGQLFSTFNDTAGLTGTATGTSLDGSSSVIFGFNGATPIVAAQRPVRGRGGFINLGLPLSRWFNADPKGRNAGWTAYLHYGFDEAYARDARRFGGRGKSDVLMSSLNYKVNSFLTFAYELSYFRTRAANNSGVLPLFRGITSRQTQNIRSEFATIFTF